MTTHIAVSVRGGLSPVAAYAMAAAVCFAALSAGSFLSTSAEDDWYRLLSKPVFTPPDWLFAVVWPVLYSMMAFAFGRILGMPATTERRNTAILLFISQLVLNVAWSFVFFSQQNPMAGVLVMVFLLATVAATGALFHRLDRWSGLVLLPYFSWLLFAGTLNAAMAMLN